MKKPKPASALIMLAVPSLVVALAGLVLMRWRIPTRIRAELTVDRMVFIVGGTETVPLLQTVNFRTVTLEKFARIELSPARLAVADPARYRPTRDQYPAAAWAPLAITRPVVITGAAEALQPAVTLEPARPDLRASGVLDRIWLRPGAEVTLEVRGTRSLHLTVQIDRQESSAMVSFQEAFYLLTRHSRVHGLAEIPFQADALTYRVSLPRHLPVVAITGQPHSLVLILTPAAGEIPQVFTRTGIPVTGLEFTYQTSRGKPETSLVRDGTLTYPDYPALGKIVVHETDFVGLGQLEKFRIEHLVLDPEQGGIRCRLDGITRYVRTGRAFPKDRRLTRFDALWRHPRLVVLFGILVWVFPTTVGGYKLYREFKR